MNIKKYVDESGLTHLWTKIEDNYPTNKDLITIINAVDEEKADKANLVGKKSPSIGLSLDMVGGEIFNDYGNNQAHDYAHAEGTKTMAKGRASHAEGTGSNLYGESLRLSATENPEIYEVISCTLDIDLSLLKNKIIYYEHTNVFSQILDVQLSESSTPVATITLSDTLASGETNADDVQVWLVLGIADGNSSHVEGSLNTAIGSNSHAEGYLVSAIGNNSHAEGCMTQALIYASHAEGEETIANGEASHAEGSTTFAEGYAAHAEGCITQALAYTAHAEGENTVASGSMSHAEGSGTEASGGMSHAEGYKTKAYEDASHAEGYETEAYERAHAEGRSSVAEGKGSHAEGYYTHAIGEYSHTEGNNTRALSEYAHAEGSDTIAKGMNSHAEGKETIAAGKNQHVQGRYNIEDTENKYAHIIGNGTSIIDDNDEEQEYRSNAHTLDWEGNAWFAGKVFIGGTSMEDATELGGGGAKLVSYNETNVATANQTEFTIDLISFDASVDTVEVYSGRTRLSPSLDYTINGNIVTLSEGLPEGRTLDIRILKNVVTPKEEVLIQGSQIAPGSIPLDRLAESIQLDKVFIRHDTTGELYRIGLDDNGLYTVKQSEQ